MGSRSSRPISSCADTPAGTTPASVSSPVRSSQRASGSELGSPWPRLHTPERPGCSVRNATSPQNLVASTSARAAPERRWSLSSSTGRPNRAHQMQPSTPPPALAPLLKTTGNGSRGGRRAEGCRRRSEPGDPAQLHDALAQAPARANRWALVSDHHGWPGSHRKPWHHPPALPEGILAAKLPPHRRSRQ